MPGRVGLFFARANSGPTRRSVHRGIERISLADFIKLIRTPRYAPARNYGRGNAPRNPWKLEKLRILAWMLHFSGPRCALVEKKKKAERIGRSALARASCPSRCDKEIPGIFRGISLPCRPRKACGIPLAVKAQRSSQSRDGVFASDIRSPVKCTGEIVHSRHKRNSKI